MTETYIVICRGDRMADEPPAPYELATRRVFDNSDDAADYASGIAAGREALVVAGRWNQLRFGASHE